MDKRTDELEIGFAVEKMINNLEVSTIKQVLEELYGRFESSGENLDSKNTDLLSKIKKLKEKL